MIERMCLCAVVFVYLLCGIELQVCAQAEDYALEIATVQTQQCAADLVQGLIARGYDAYSIPYRSSKGNKSIYFRIRIGKFQDMNYARRYGESLMSTGLLDTCAVTTYESPLTTLDKIISSITGDVGLKRIEVKTKLTDRFNVSCPVDLMSQFDAAANRIGERNGGEGTPENLLAVLDRNTWAVSADRGVLYSSPRSMPARFLTSNADASVNNVIFSMRSLARTNWRLSADPKLLNLAASNASNRANRPAQSEVQNTANNVVRSNAVNNSAAPRTVPSTVTVAKASPPPIVAVAEKNVRTLPPTVSQPSTPSIPVAPYDIGPPKIQGFIEQRNGRLLLHVINSDSQRLFTGSARVTLSDERLESELSPQVFRLNPNEEKVIDLKPNAVMSHGDWLLMVFDDRKAIQLIRSAPFGNKPGQSGNNNGIMNTIISAFDQSKGDDKKDEKDESVSWAEDDDGAVKGGGDNSKDNAISQDLINQIKQDRETNKQDREQNRDTNKQVQVSIMRLSTTDKGTLVDMNIISTVPVGNARILFQSGAFRDDRAVILSSLTARIPFFIPIAITTNECTYIIKDDNNNILASGSARY